MSQIDEGEVCRGGMDPHASLEYDSITPSP